MSEQQHLLQEDGCPDCGSGKDKVNGGYVCGGYFDAADASWPWVSCREDALKDSGTLDGRTVGASEATPVQVAPDSGVAHHQAEGEAQQ